MLAILRFNLARFHLLVLHPLSFRGESMSIHALAGKPAPAELLVNIPELVSAYFTSQPDPEDVTQAVSFGTSGHRGTSAKSTFNQPHIEAICQAICEYRHREKVTGPLHLGKDTHALSEPAFQSAIEVFAANGVDVRVDQERGYTPTPVISHAILTYNRGRSEGLADGVVITPSHNPPEDGGIKYNATNGGPAAGAITSQIQDRANEILREGGQSVRKIPFLRALQADSTQLYDYRTPYVKDLGAVVDMEAIQRAGVSIGVDPMGGSGIGYWEPIAEAYGLQLNVVNTVVDPTFRFMCVDRDGKIRMDCSSPYAMAGLIDLKSDFDIAFGNDPDFDRHGIVTKSGLMNPNHYLAVAIEYLFAHRPQWGPQVAVGKTLVSSSMIDRVATKLGRQLCEVPVGFKWFVDGLESGELGFAGEESAGASFLRLDGSVWSTDKDGIILALLAAEITAVTGKDPSQHYAELEKEFGRPCYSRIDAPATREEKAALASLSPSAVRSEQLAGDPITAKLTEAPGNQASIGGLKVVTERGWFAARPSGTEEIYKIYAESFVDEAHLRRIQEEAKQIVAEALA